MVTVAVSPVGIVCEGRGSVWGRVVVCGVIGGGISSELKREY